jgi:hypothetical protein
VSRRIALSTRSVLPWPCRVDRYPKPRTVVLPIPQSGFQLVAVLLLLVPGLVFAGVRRRLAGPGPEDRDFSVRLARAVAASVILDLCYVLILGSRVTSPFVLHDTSRHTTLPAITRGEAFLGLLLLIVIPTGLAAGSLLRLDEKEDGKRRIVRPSSVYDPTPTSWDRVAPARGECFVRIMTQDGYWVGGWLGSDAFVATYPEARDIFIDIEWQMSETGGFEGPVPDSRGLYVPLDGQVRVAWLKAPDQSA